MTAGHCDCYKREPVAKHTDHDHGTVEMQEQLELVHPIITLNGR